MSLSGALSNALSGLTASSRAASVISSNVANALTDGYGPRDINLSTRLTGSHGGVQVDSVSRRADPRIIHDLRLASADRESSDVIATFHQRLETLLGTPEDEFSLPAQIAKFENSLIAASSRPDLPERLETAVSAAKSLAQTFTVASDSVQAYREQADTDIANAVDRINLLTKQVEDINVSLLTARNTGGDVNGLLDHRQKIIDEIAEYLPVREVPRQSGAVALMLPGGAFLIDGKARELGFAASPVITPYQSIEEGTLSGLTLDDQPLDPASQQDMGEGRLSALFKIRDSLAPEIQTRLDTAARDLIERFQQSGLDTTRGAGSAGLFTDNNLAFVSTDERGIASRIAVSASVLPEEGGAVWRLRDGLGASAPGVSGDATLLNDLRAALQETRVPSSTSLGVSMTTASGLASNLLSLTGSERQRADEILAFDVTRQSELHERLLENGVDTDQEMQRLLLVEQSYAANARMIQTASELLDILIRI
ncbi:flagellar hook-associated protein FlgK [Pseudooceanicola sp. C21-150M6]|uniref:flagellar hook-associated protein FlgK n=1 Tax=Pseudooceanicola sp. C21-150M6 TaxID=3434355 RepID=UPI003D7F1C05